MKPQPKLYWEKAGAAGYGEAMFANAAVEEHVNRRLWNIAADIGEQLGLDRSSRILDLGCGDGAFANRVLSARFGQVDGFDLSEAAIARAKAEATTARFEACDVTRIAFDTMAPYDGAFLIGILHHVKAAAPALIRSLRRAAGRVVVLEPNGDHLLRRLLERTPAYRAAGEDSFGTRPLERMFESAGYRQVVWRRLNLFPNFTPGPVFRALRSIEPLVENTPGLRALCTVNLYGFKAQSADTPCW